MDSTQLAAITDANVLRSIVAENLIGIAARDAKIAQHEAQRAEDIAQIAAHAARIAQHEAQALAHQRAIVYKDSRIEQLTLQIARLRRMQFDARSEKMDPEQRALFDEAVAADIAAVETELEGLQSEDGKTPAKPPRRKSQRRPLPPELPRIETRHEPESCTCGQCGAALVPIGEHVSEKLDVKPLEFFVRRDVYPQYACRGCQTITAVPVAASIVDRGIAAPGLIAQVAISKYVDHLPLYRQEAIYTRSGVEIGRTSMAEWMGAAGVALQPLVAVLRNELLGHPVLHADETPVAMLDPGAGKTKRAYLFAYRTATDDPIVVFDFCISRSGRHAKHFLGDYRGALMVDDYGGYKALFANGVTELGCWAHARRKFVDLHKASGSEIAQEAINRIAALYQIEAKARDLDDAARHAYRQCHAAPLVHDLKTWLVTLRPTVAGNSGTANAIDYTLRRWPALARYLEDGRYPIDNNPIENAIRPIALGRKNWLFAGSETAGQRAAAIMSLLATAKANGRDPHAWLTDVLTRLPTTRDRDIEELLPHRWQPKG
jgi:transposase